MKKLMLMSALFLGMCTAVIAQQTATQAPTTTPPQAGQRPNNRGNGNGNGYHAGAPADRAAKMANHIKAVCGLDDATTQKVTQICLERDQKVDAIQTGSQSNRDKNTALMANKDDFEGKIKAVLTPDQFNKFLAMKKHGQGGDGDHDADGNGNGGKRGNKDHDKN